MKRYSLLSVLALASCVAQPAFAQDANVRTGIILESTCEMVAQSESVAGGAVGGAVGSVAGGLLAGLVFGRDYVNAGAALGGVGGTVVGANSNASRTYKCLVKARTNTGDVYVETTGRIRNVGQSIVLVKDGNGNWLVRS